MNSPANSKVIWAIDPNLDARTMKLQLATFKALDKITAGQDVEIEPVAVLRPEQMKVPASAFRSLMKNYEIQFETDLKAMLKPIKSKKLIAPRLLIQDNYSLNVSLDVLLKYAEKVGATLIAVGSHSRKGMERMFMGSFAETLLLKASVPVLVVNPKSPLTKKVGHIFFPTDLTDASRKIFDRVIRLASTLKAKLTIYHKVEYVLPGTMDALTYSPIYHQYLKTDVEQLRAKGKEWCEYAGNRGVKAKFELDEKKDYVSESIIKVAKKSKADIIAMAANSGSVVATFLGSVARSVVRSSTLPVWVIRGDK